MEVRESIVLPVEVETAWEVLSDLPRMVERDPLLVDYQPENGVIEEGTLNRVTTKVGPLRMKATSRTAVLDPPHRVVFESVEPAAPVRITTEDRLDPAEGGCRYQVTSTIVPTNILGRLVAPLMGRTIARTRRRLMADLHQELSA